MRDLLKLLRFLMPYSKQTALAVLLGVLTVATNVGLLATAAYLIAAAALKPLLIALTGPIYLVRFFGLSRAFARYAERLTSHNVTFRLLANLRTWLYSRIEPLVPARLVEYRSGDLLARMVKDIEELQNLYQQALAPVIVAAITSLLTFWVLYGFSPRVSFVVLGLMLVAGIGVPALAGVLSRGLGQRQLALRAELDARIVDGVQGMRDLLAFGQASSHERKVAELDRELGEVQRRYATITGLRNGLNDAVANLAMWATLLLAIPLIARGEIQGVYLAMLALLVLSSFEGIQPLGQAFQLLGRSLAAGRRMFEIVDVEPRVRDPERPLPTVPVPDLEFDHVSFAYGECEPLAVKDVTFELSPGSRVAVVGPSGSGKSTLVNLALRFWDPTSGTVRLGGHDLREYGQEGLRASFGVMSRDTYVFNDTLRSNLLLARPDAADAEMEEALRAAQLWDFVCDLPKGLDTWLGEQGARLSGGERQRLALARSLLKDAPILILDEATANLDPVTEEELRKAVHGLVHGRTVLTITHRLIGMEEMDEILVMDRGEIVERGTHDGLLARGGLYRRMTEVQNQVFAMPSENPTHALDHPML